VRRHGHVALTAAAVLLATCAGCAGDHCEDVPLARAEIDAPGSAAAGAPFDIHIRDASEGCVAAELSCRTALHAADNTVLLVVSGPTCPPRPERPCDAAEVTCTVAPLFRGDYRISLNGAPPAHPFHVQ
jgi:hypothetical protein